MGYILEGHLVLVEEGQQVELLLLVDLVVFLWL